MSRKKLIIDCDPGTDDAHAILMALAACDDVDVLAITTVYGNSFIEDTTRNVVRLLTYYNRLDIPVFKGCASSLTFSWKRTKPSNPYHGHDGLGDVLIDGVDPIDVSSIKNYSNEHASTAMCRLVSENPGDITLVAIGPLTNVAVALMLDGQFGEKLKNCVIMGGNFMGQEDVGTSAEFNWTCDPEAAHCVLAALHTPITLFPVETCLKAAVTWEWYDAMAGLPTKSAALLKKINEHTVHYLLSQHSDKYGLYDQLAVAYVINSSVATEVQPIYATIELHGTLTRGQMVIDWKNTLDRKPNVSVVTGVDQQLCEQLAAAAFQLDF